MNLLIDFICLLFVFEIFLTFMFILFILGLKVYRISIANDTKKLHEDVEKIFLYRIEEFSELTPADVKKINKDMLITLRILEYLEKRYILSNGWRFVKNEIINKVIRIEAPKLCHSKDELNEYVSARLYLFHYDKADVSMVESLIRNPSIFISVSAAKVGFKYSDDTLINVSIDVFAQYRRLQRSVLSTIAEDPTPRSEEIVVERLLREQDPYIRAFCYSIMMQFPLHESLQDMFTRYVKAISNKLLPPFRIIQHISEALLRDLSSNVLDLKLAALNYAGHNPAYQSMVSHYLNDVDWQVRASAARITGQIKDQKSIVILQRLLTDREWWVRVRAAQALANLGQEGIKVLQSINPQSDKYAYEAAMQVLISSHHKETK